MALKTAMVSWNRATAYCNGWKGCWWSCLRLIIVTDREAPFHSWAPLGPLRKHSSLNPNTALIQIKVICFCKEGQKHRRSEEAWSKEDGGSKEDRNSLRKMELCALKTDDFRISLFSPLSCFQKSQNWCSRVQTSLFVSLFCNHLSTTPFFALNS